MTRMSRNFSLAFFTLIAGLSSHHALAQSIENLIVEDSFLLDCIQKEAEKNHWQESQDVRKLTCHGLKISSLKGLEQLNNLERLSLYNNKLTLADLRSFKRLEYINIANNKLQSIKLTGLAKLKTLYLFKNNLTTLNFTGLIQLKKVRITNNKLSSLDISPLTSLEKAYFFDNKLEDLIISGLPKLTFIELKQNPMPDEVYDRYDELEGITIIHDGNTDDWK